MAASDERRALPRSSRLSVTEIYLMQVSVNLDRLNPKHVGTDSPGVMSRICLTVYPDRPCDCGYLL